jgi:O-antigen ligase
VGRMLAWAGVAAGAVYLIYVGGAWWGIYSAPLRIATMAMAAVTLAAWAIVMRRNPAWRPRSVMLPAIAACLGSLAISTAFSRDIRVSLEYLGYAIVLAALYLLLVRLFASDFFRRRIAVLATMLFAVSVAVYLATVVAGWIDWWRLVGSIGVPPLRPGFTGLTYNNPSAVLTMVCLLAIPTVALFGGATRRGIAVILTVLGSIAVVALVSGSRAGWFAIGLTMILAGVGWLAPRGNRRTVAAQTRHILASQAGRVVVGGAAIVLVGLAVVFAPAVIRRALEPGEDLRVGYAVTAVRMFADSPIIGTGPGTWVIQRATYTNAPELDYYIPHAHNLEVQSLAELGLVGAAAGAVLVVSIAVLLIRAARGADRDRRWWAWAAGIGLTYFVLHQVLDFYVNMPAFLFAAALPIAYLDASTPVHNTSPAGSAGPRFPARMSGPGLPIAAVVVSIAVAALVWQEIPALRQGQAVDLANSDDWAGADGPARDAAAIDPDIDSYAFTAGLTSDRAGDHAAAADYFQHVADRDDLPEAWMNLAAEQVALGKNEAAHVSIDHALRLGYQRDDVAVAAADLALRLGDRTLAIAQFGLVVARSPTLAGDPWWRSDPARAAIYPDVIAAAMPISTVGWQIALMSGDSARARTMTGAPTTFESLVVSAWADRTAAGPLQAVCQTNTLDISQLTWCARVEAHLGDDAGAERYRERVSLINLGAAFDAGLVRVSPSGMVLNQLVGDPADLWATYTYRRPAPWDILVPSLVHLTLD